MHFLYVLPDWDALQMAGLAESFGTWPKSHFLTQRPLTSHLVLHSLSLLSHTDFLKDICYNLYITGLFSYCLFIIFFHYLNVISMKAEALFVLFTAVFLVTKCQPAWDLGDSKCFMLLYLCSCFCHGLECSLPHIVIELSIL